MIGDPQQQSSSPGPRRRARPRVSRAACALLVAVAPARAAAASPWVLELPLTGGGAAVEAAIGPLGGSVHGGSFGPMGWTTTASTDRIEVPLPPGIDASRGRLAVTVAALELSGPKGYFESYHLVTLDSTGVPFKATDAGQAGIQTLYVAYSETDEVMARAKAYFNLADAGCDDWMLCTHEVGTPKGWLVDGAGPFAIEHAWEGTSDTVTFMPGGGAKSMDLGGTAPDGSFAAPQLHLVVNACGGSLDNACGLWNGPLHGGPIGAVYSQVRLELHAECGDGACSAGLEDEATCPTDCVATTTTSDTTTSEAPATTSDTTTSESPTTTTDTTLTGSGPTSDGDLTTSAPGSSVTGESGGVDTSGPTSAASTGASARSSDDGCACAARGPDFPSPAWLLMLAPAALRRRRRGPRRLAGS